MTGLLRKDFYLMRSLLKSYLLILAIFGVLTVAGVYDASFLASFLALVCIMCPVSLFAYDEQAKWDKYAAALPSGRAGVIKGRYLFTLIISLGSLALICAIEIVVFSLGKGEDTLVDTLFSGIVPAAFGVLMNAILLPLLFKFGAQKGRIYLMVVIGVCMGAVFGGLAVLSKLDLTPTAILLPLSLLPPVCILTLVPSYFLSLRIYRRKDL